MNDSFTIKSITCILTFSELGYLPISIQVNLGITPKRKSHPNRATFTATNKPIGVVMNNNAVNA